MSRFFFYSRRRRKLPLVVGDADRPVWRIEAVNPPEPPSHVAVFVGLDDLHTDREHHLRMPRTQPWPSRRTHVQGWGAGSIPARLV